MRDMVNNQDYKLLLNSLKNTLEQEYAYYIANGDIANAYNIIGKLMQYKLIDKTDERLDSKYKVFKKGGIDPKHRFPLDIRKDSNYIHKWVYADIPSYINTKLVAVEHIGVRVEGVYEGEMIYPERVLDIQFKLANTERKARECVERFADVFKEETGKGLKVESTARDLQSGVSRIYEISIDSAINCQYKILGYALLTKSNKDGKFYAKIILKSKVFKHYYIRIDNGYKHLERVLADGLGIKDIKVGNILNYSKKIEEQLEILKVSNYRIKENLKFRESAK